MTYNLKEKFFDILEEVKKEEQTTIETLFERIGGVAIHHDEF